MTEYIATFYSHFGAMRFQKELKAQGIQARMMPVPRSLSSSCGTAVLFQAEKGQIPGNRHRELEQIVQIKSRRRFITFVKRQPVHDLIVDLHDLCCLYRNAVPHFFRKAL